MSLSSIIIVLLITLIACVVVSWVASAPTRGETTTTLDGAPSDGWIHWRDARDRTARSAHWVAPGQIPSEGTDFDFEGDEEVTEPLPRVDGPTSIAEEAVAAR